jgi:hypothetical protein
MLRALVTACLLVAATATSAETKDDRLCRAIGETKTVALQPRDRIFFEDNCECVQWRDTPLGCAKKKGSHVKKLRADAAAMEAAYQETERKRAAEVAAKVKREKELTPAIIDACNAYNRCVYTAGVTCGAEHDKYEALCAEVPNHKFCQGLSTMGCKE